MNLILMYFALKYKGDFISIYNALKNKEIVDPHEIDELERKINDNILTIDYLFFDSNIYIYTQYDPFNNDMEAYKQRIINIL